MSRIRVVWLSVLGLLLVVVLAACNSSPTTGSLTVKVNGLPSGVAGKVLVTGPGGYATTVTTSGTLSGLTPGSYSVTGSMARASGAIVDTAYTATGGGSVNVSANATATSSVTYSVLTGSGKLWVTDEGVGTYGFDASQLGATGSPTPAVSLGNSGGADGLALDAQGNLWVGFYTAGQLAEYSVSQLGASGSPTPAVVIGSDGSSLSGPVTLAFDAQGDLWAGQCGNGNLEEYTPSQLAASGTPTPAVVLTGFICPSGMVFDSQGNLWVGTDGSLGVVKLTPSQLQSSGSPTPAVSITTSNNYEGVTFDKSGNLWVADISANQVVMFTPAQIAASGSPTPTITISDSGSGALNEPVAVLFDNGGNLWVSNIGSTPNNVLKYSASDLTTTGSPAPAVVISETGSFDWPQLVFDPPILNP